MSAMPPLPNGTLKKPSQPLNLSSTVSSDQSRSMFPHQLHGIQVINLHKESERLKTFEQWPIKFISPQKMAEAGFYYSQQGDTVRCIFCGIEIGKWTPGDDPLEDHKKWAPECRFIRKQPVGNIPLNADNEQGCDTCGPSGVQGVILGETSLLEVHSGFQKSRPPSFPRFASIDARLRSYETWPISLKLKPSVLSDAGFFYTGKGDQTICYHCGGGLKDWEETDQPWVEHARWFSKCPYVLLVKGKEFVDEVCGLKAGSNQDLKQKVGLSLCSSTGDIPRAASTSILTTSKGGSKPSDGQEELTSKGTLSNSSSRKEEAVSDGRSCKICYAEEIGVVFLPCGHLVACVKCASSLTTCVVCRKPVEGTFRTFFS